MAVSWSVCFMAISLCWMGKPNKVIASVAPPGLILVLCLTARLTPWATLYRPSGANGSRRGLRGFAGGWIGRGPADVVAMALGMLLAEAAPLVRFAHSAAV